MKVFIAKNTSSCPQGTRTFPSDWMYPHEIRHALSKLLDEDACRDRDTAPELAIVTVDITVLNEVRHADCKDGTRLSYEDVFVDTAKGMVPLLDLHSADMLCHSYLGSFFARFSHEWFEP